MSEHMTTSNYEQAKEQADIADKQIIEALKLGKSFRVEAGAGSGKTYSLNKVIEWIQNNKSSVYKNSTQKVVCITYTNTAVNVIKERVSNDTFIIPSTIHSFAWNAIKPFQSSLIERASDLEFSSEDDDSEIREVTYTIGHKCKKDGVVYLDHDEVLAMFCGFLDNAKFRRLFANNYPLILIDEYQDSHKPIIDRFLKFFIADQVGPQFGFFGDSWQTIYQSNKACGEIKHDNLVVINKTSNFRSAPRIVELLNCIRPDLVQTSAIDNFQGEAVVITCDDYVGMRRKDKGAFKDDLPSDELCARVDCVTSAIRQKISSESIKVLMITHKVLAEQQGYSILYEILYKRLKDKSDSVVLFFSRFVEPLYLALDTSNMQLLFDILIKPAPVKTKADKCKWASLYNALKVAREQRAIDVIELLYKSDLIGLPQNIVELFNMYINEPEHSYNSSYSIKDFLDIDYKQFLAAIEFSYPQAIFSTEHGVKGEEYDNVLFVISKGWSQYQFDKYAPMLTGQIPIPKDKQQAFERNRNLFYVCCSRPRKRLFFFISVPINLEFKKFLLNLVGEENYYTYSQFVEGKYTHQLKTMSRKNQP